MITAKENKRFDRRFSLDPIIIKSRVMVGVRGRVINTGEQAWDNLGEPADREFRIGIRVYKEDHSLVYEDRYYLKRHSINPGQYIDFSFIINIVKFPAGKYFLKINILKEHCFWFDDIGMPSEVLNFELGQEPTNKKSEYLDSHGYRDKKGKRILFVVPNFPQFDKSSGENRLFEILRLFKIHRYKVTLFAENSLDSAISANYYKEIKRLNFEYFDNPYVFFMNLKNDEYNVCIIVWHNLASKYLDILRCILPHSKIIVDSVDVHWVRELRGIEAGIANISSLSARENKNRESSVYRKADIVWTVTKEDRKNILAEIPDCKIRIVSNIHRKYKKYISNPNKNAGIIFVGGFKHPPNESAAIWGYEICQKLRERLDIPFVYYILGNSPSAEVMSLHDGKNTTVTGFVPDLYEYYKKSKIMLVPLRHGSGIKGKICHAICSGIPVITTTIGNEGLGLEHEKEAFIANTTEEFLSALIKVFSGQVDLKEMNKRALRKVLNITSEKKNWQAIEDSILD